MINMSEKTLHIFRFSDVDTSCDLRRSGSNMFEYYLLTSESVAGSETSTTIGQIYEKPKI
jgi:hypothetical protein